MKEYRKPELRSLGRVEDMTKNTAGEGPDNGTEFQGSI